LLRLSTHKCVRVKYAWCWRSSSQQ
jgi:hypothetical protein